MAWGLEFGATRRAAGRRWIEAGAVWLEGTRYGCDGPRGERGAIRLPGKLRNYERRNPLLRPLIRQFHRGDYGLVEGAQGSSMFDAGRGQASAMENLLRTDYRLRDWMTTGRCAKGQGEAA